jgi:hypothetical protein
MRGRRMQTGALFTMVQRHWFMLWMVRRNPYLSIQYYTTVASLVSYTHNMPHRNMIFFATLPPAYIQTNPSTQALAEPP